MNRFLHHRTLFWWVTRLLILFVSVLIIRNVFFLSARDKYISFVQDMSLQDIRYNYVYSAIGYGAILNAIPFLHLIGLTVDTTIVFFSIRTIVLSNGAILERDLRCPGLLQNDDYDIFIVWQSNNSSIVMKTFDDLSTVKNYSDDLSIQMSSYITKMAKSEIERQIELKITSKILLKISVKTAVKLVTGFVPLIGPAAAGVINYLILDDISDKSVDYFRAKARILCHSGY